MAEELLDDERRQRCWTTSRGTLLDDDTTVQGPGSIGEDEGAGRRETARATDGEDP
ncbi:mechanosensitive channel protein [Sesbania bispinosa]|nr:mechanosensitive channel protein [Sesbania bispinosa]